MFKNKINKIFGFLALFTLVFSAWIVLPSKLHAAINSAGICAPGTMFKISWQAVQYADRYEIRVVDFTNNMVTNYLVDGTLYELPNVQSAQVRAIAKPYSNFENSAWTLPALSPCAPSPQTLDTSGIKIVKEVVGGSFSDVFNFKYYKTNVNSGGTVSSSISLGQNSEHLFTNQPSGSNFLYKIEELPVSGYALTKIKCISNNSSWTLTAPLNARSVEFNYLDSTATITCTFTNTKTRGTSSVNIYNQLPDFASLNNLTQIQIPPSSPTPTSIGVTVVVEHDDYPPVLSGYSQPPANFSYTAYPDGVSFTLSKYPHGPQIFPPSKNIMPESLIKIVQSYSPTGLPAYMVAPDGLTAFPPYKLTGVSCASNGSATFTNDYASGILTGVNINGYSPNDSTVCTFTNSN